jgi:hypothetical protein
MAVMRLRHFAAIALLVLGAGCQPGPAPPADTGSGSVAVLVVAHGSPAASWTAAVEALVNGAGTALRSDPLLKDLQLAYIAESGPTIAEQMRRFDAAGIREVVIVPLLVAAESTRTNNYLQYLAGLRSEAAAIRQLQNEGYDLYRPRARVSLTPALSDSNVLKKNTLRRVTALLGDDDGEDAGLVLVGYGDRVYGQQMEEIMDGIGRNVKLKTRIDTIAYAFCGKLTDYSGTPVVEAINEVLGLEDRAIVVPVLLAVDPRLQVDTIQAAVNAIETPSRVRYEPDAVLPDPAVEEWLVGVAREALDRVRQAGT